MLVPFNLTIYHLCHFTFILRGCIPDVGSQLKVYVYRADELPAVDSNGLCDPYVVTRFEGQNVGETAIKRMTLYPEFNEAFSHR